MPQVQRHDIYAATNRSPDKCSVDLSLIRLLKLCQQTDSPELYPRALDRVLAKSQLRSHRNNLRSVLTPLLTSLLKFIKSIKKDPWSPPFCTAVTIIVSTFVRYVLGPKPEAQSVQTLMQRYSRLGCACTMCNEISVFLTTSRESHKTWHRIGATKVDHAIARLYGLPGVETEIHRRPSPQSLEVGYWYSRD